MMNSASYSTDLYNSEMDNLYRMVKSETRRDAETHVLKCEPETSVCL